MTLSIRSLTKYISTICLAFAINLGIDSDLAFATSTPLTVNVVDVNGSPMPSDSFLIFCDSPQNDAFGFTTVSSNNQGTVSIDITSTKSVSCFISEYSGFGTSNKGSVTLVPGVANSVNVTLKAVDATINLELRDTANNLLTVTSFTSFTCTATNDVFYQGSIAGGQSSGSISVLGGFTYSCSFDSAGIAGYSTPTSPLQTVAVASNTTIIITATAFDATLRINFKDINGTAIAAPSGVSGYCYNTTQGVSFSFDTILNNDTFAQVSVLGGLNYSCYIFNFSGYVDSAVVEITAVANQTTQKDFILYLLDGSLTTPFTVNGTPLNGLTASVTCSSYGPDHTTTGSTTSTDITLSVLKGATYSCTGSVPNYITAGNPRTTIPSSGTATLAIPLLSLDSTVNFSFKDANGNPISAPSGAALSCYETGSYLLSQYIYIDFAATGASTTLVGGYDYSCSLNGFTNYSSSSKNIKPTSGGTLSADLVLNSLDAAIQFNFVNSSGVALTIPSGSSFAGAYCTSATDSSTYFYGELSSGSSSEVLPVVGAQQYNCYIYGIANYSVSSLDPITVTANQTKQVNVTLKSLDATLNFSFVNAQGTAIAIPAAAEYPSVNCYSSDDSYSSYYKELNANETSTSLPVVAGTYQCSLYGITGYATTGTVTGTVVSGGTTALSFVLTPLDASIVVGLVDSNGNSFQLGSGAYASVSCSSSDYVYYFYETVTSSSTTVPVLGALQYNCSVYLNDFATTSVNVSVGAGASSSATIQVLARTATVSLLIKDNNGVAISLDAYLSAYSLDSTFQDYVGSTISGSSHSVLLVPNKSYGLSVDFITSDSAQIYGVLQLPTGEKYLQSQSGQTVTPLEGQTVTKELVLTKADSSIVVNVDDPTISAPDNSDLLWVSAAAYLADGVTTDPNSNIGVSVARDGSVTIPAVSGRKYLVQLFTNGSIAPIPQDVSIGGAGETKTVNFVLETATFTLTAGVSGVSDTGLFSCWAYDTNGRFSFSDQAPLSATVSVPLVVGSWFVGCNAYTLGATSKSYYTLEQSYTVAAGTSAGSLTLALIEGSSIFEAQQTIATGYASKTQITADLKIDVPAGAFAETAVVTASNRVTTPNLGDVEVVRGTGVTVSAANQNGGTLAVQNGEITVTIIMNQSQLPSGATFDDISAGQYSPESGWTTLTSTNDGAIAGSGAETNASISRGFKIALRNLRKPVSLIKRGVRAATVAPTPVVPVVTPPGFVTKIKAKIKKPKRITNRAKAKATVTASWLAATGTVDSYTIALKVSKKKTITKTVSGSTLKAAFKNIKAGSYTVTITAVNSGGSGTSKRKKFKVKF